MQTSRSQSQQAGEKIAAPAFRAHPSGFFSELLKSNKNFRFWLSAIIIYPFLLFFVLFSVMLVRLGLPTRVFIYNASAVLLSTVSLFVIAWVLLNAVVKERRRQQRE